MAEENIVYGHLGMVEKDPWLLPDEAELMDRYDLYRQRLAEIEAGSGSIVDFANGYKYYGFNYSYEDKGWWFREWLPAAREVYLFGDFNDWNKKEILLERTYNGNWEVFFPDSEFGNRLVHGSEVKLLVNGCDGSWLERIPSYIRRAVEDPATHNYNGQLWAPEKEFDWTGDSFDIRTVGSLLIYECHMGMAQEEAKVGTYNEFTEKILPRIKEEGYNAIQLMAIAEHPYYGSFGYHVSNFFAPSSRFGTPEELKNLIKTAHCMGIAVIMDIVHSHFVKNINEGLNKFDGSDIYSPPKEKGDHPHWDSKLFDYSKGQVQHFLLSNIKYWMEEFHFDGFRFDGVTSMIYNHHGYTEFDDRKKFFDDTVNRDGLLYLTLANKLIHSIKPEAVTIAEDVSGMPGMCFTIEDGGVGFDYRLGMAIADFWIKLLKDQHDENWDIWDMWNIMTNRLPYVKTIAYCESHDQALVGDKTLAFRLMDKDMYFNMNRASKSIVVDRGIALHKMIRLFTISLGGQAYLNFMGNEFGHPEWIDFPRAGNKWSYNHARRQWSLADNGFLRYSYLAEFDKAMVALVKKYNVLGSGYGWNLQMDEKNQTIVFSHNDLLFVFNWSPTNSIPDYATEVRYPGRYRIILSTDEKRFGGADRLDKKARFFTYPHTFPDGTVKNYMQIYNVNRCATVYKKLAK
ncbi:MAG: alpha amylase C-terminal domain-containing protein [Rikenellaceae bacterium]|nr:alpha amylase C-terminal domain-containing protein [Rikenellaceae bacterium]